MHHLLLRFACCGRLLHGAWYCMWPTPNHATAAPQVFNIAETFRAKGIPCDGLHIDVDFADRYKSFTYNKEAFPEVFELFEVLAGKVRRQLHCRDACLCLCELPGVWRAARCTRI